MSLESIKQQPYLQANQEEELTRVRATLHTANAERAALEERLSRLQLDCEQKDVQVRGLRASNDDLSERADVATKLQQVFSCPCMYV